jgi:signal transduction histidine kinase
MRLEVRPMDLAGVIHAATDAIRPAANARGIEISATRRHGGLGLGLALVRHLVELHGGTVAVKSAEPDQGSTFIVQLPSQAQLR